MVLDASPSPHVLVVAVALAVLQDAGGHHPHDHAEDEPTDGKQRVVDTDLLGPVVTTAAVSDEDKEADTERYARGSKHNLLGP